MLIGAIIILYGLFMVGAAPVIFFSTKKVGEPQWPWWMFSVAIVGVAIDRVLQGIAVVQGAPPPMSLPKALLYAGVGFSVLAGSVGLQRFLQAWYDDRERRFQRSIWSSLAEVFMLEPGTLRVVDHNRGAEGWLPGNIRAMRFTELLASPVEPFLAALEPLESGDVPGVEILAEMKTVDGSAPVRISMQAVDGPETADLNLGTPERVWMAFVTDSSALRDAQQREAEQAERFRIMAESIEEGIVLTDLEGTILYESPQAGPMVGVDHTSRIGGFVLDHIAPEQREGARKMLRDLARGASDVLEGVVPFVRATTGETVYLDFKSRRVEVPAVGPSLLFSYRDVTNRVLNENRRRNAEERLRRQQQAVADIGRSDALRRGNVQEVAELAAERLVLGLPVSRASIWVADEGGRTFRMLVVNDEQDDELDDLPDDLPTVLYPAECPVYFQSLEGSRAMEICDTRSDARTVELLEGYLEPTGVTAMLDAPIRVGGLGGIVCAEERGGPRDWTPEEVSFVSEIADLMALAVQERRRLDAENERLTLESQLRIAQRMETVGVLAGGIAHDFNNLLTPILGYTDMALAELPDHARGDSALVEIRSAGERAQALVKQLLTFSRQMDQEREPVMLDSLLREVLRLSRATLPSTIDLATEISSEVAPVDGDPSQLHQVFLNLVANAGHAMKRSGGTLSVILDGLLVTDLMAEERPGIAQGVYARVRIADTGTGMDSATLERVFEPFFTTKPKGEGTGLGMAVSHGIITSHGGHISVQSELGAGTTVEILLPLSDAARPEELDLPAPGVERHEGLEILVVDDEPAVGRFVSRVLDRAGYQVHLYTSSLEAAQAVESGELVPQCMLTDQTMPGLTGLGLVQRVRRVLPDLPVFIMSGYDTALDAPALEAAGVRQFLRKPFRGKELLRVLEDRL